MLARVPINNQSAVKPARSPVIRFSRDCVAFSVGWGEWAMGIGLNLAEYHEMLTVVILLLSVAPDSA